MEKSDIAKDYKIFEGPLKVELIKVLKGANYFSAGPIVLTRLNLGEFDEVFSNEIDGFYEKLESLIPSLYEHHCSEGKPGGFLFRVRKGTLMGHVIEHVAIELQTLAGMHAGYGKTRSTLKQGVYNIIFRFIDDQAGIYAAKAAVNLVNSILLNKEFPVKPIIETLLQIREERLLGPSTQSIVDEATKRNIPVFRLDQHNLIQLGTGKYHKKIRATITSETHFIAVENAADKFLTTLSFRDAGLPVPESYRTNSISKATKFFKELASNAVVKPITGSKGDNVFINLSNEKAFKKAFQFCFKEKHNVIVQKHVEGNTFRILVINGKMVAATKLTSPEIIGDGVKTVSKLIDELNSNAKREPGDKGKLSYVIIDKQADRILDLLGLTKNSILEEGKKIRIKSTCNPSHGSLTENVTEIVHPENRFLAERAATVSGLNVAGVTIIAKDIALPITETDGVILEVNAGPDFRMHVNPLKGLSINPAVPMLDMLFPKDLKSKVPLVSITGSAGKSVCAYLINFALEKEGLKTGLACSDGLFSAGRKVITGNMTFPENVTALLSDSDIECAILETSVEGILKNGLGYNFADVGIFLNLYDNHLNHDDIWLKEDLAYAKSVVVEEVYEEGFSVLNADEPFIMDCLSRLYSKPALFTKNAANKEFTSHITKGGMGVCIRDEKVFLHYRSGRWALADIKEIPLTFAGATDIFLESILAACCALAALGVKPENIGEYIKTFTPLTHNIPGRMNFIKQDNIEILVDIPSNNKAFEEIKKLCQLKEKPPAVFISSNENITENELSQLAKDVLSISDKIFVLPSYNKEAITKSSQNSIEDDYIISLKAANNQEFTSNNKKPNTQKKLYKEIEKLKGKHQTVEIITKEIFSDTIKKCSTKFFPVILNAPPF